MKKKIMAVLLALAMVTQGAMPVFAQNEGAEELRQRQMQKRQKFCARSI